MAKPTRTITHEGRSYTYLLNADDMPDLPDMLPEPEEMTAELRLYELAGFASPDEELSQQERDELGALRANGIQPAQAT